MSNELNGRLGRTDCLRGKGLPFLLVNSTGRAAALALLMGVIGCQNPQPSRQPPPLSQFAELKDAEPAVPQAPAMTREQLDLARRLVREASTNGVNLPTPSTPRSGAPKPADLRTAAATPSDPRAEGPSAVDRKAGPEPGGLVLREGDVIKVAFPGAPDLNTTVTIQRDGMVTLPLVGQVKAAGLAPGEMEKEVLRRCGSELQVKEVSVAVVSSAFAVYVTGTVLRPGKVLSERPLSALEAIMEAGGVDYGRANLKKVTLIRRENGRLEHHIVNLKKELKGQTTEPFMLKPLDILYVPERFAWF